MINVFWLAIAGTILVLAASFYYVADILRGGTKPHRVSWGVWALIGLLGVGSALEGGAGIGAAVAVMYLVAQVLVFGLSLFPKYGKSGGSNFDYVLGLLAVATILFWRFGSLSVTIAAGVAITADVIASWPTLREGWRQPWTESTLAWGVSAIGAGLSLTALESWSFAAVAYPVYLFVMVATMATILLLRRKLRQAHLVKKNA